MASVDHLHGLSSAVPLRHATGQFRHLGKPAVCVARELDGVWQREEVLKISRVAHALVHIESEGLCARARGSRGSRSKVDDFYDFVVLGCAARGLAVAFTLE